MGFCGGLFYIFFLLFFMILLFPLPYNDAGSSVRYKTFPFVTISLVLINSMIFLVWIAPKLYLDIQFFASQRDALAAIKPYIDLVWTYGYRESYVRDGISIGAFTTFTSMFMHADIGHLLGNMAYLWAFGHRLEDACGHARFLAFYLLSGMVANLGSVILNPSTTDLPGIGASGAIAGIVGAYLLLFYDAKVNVAWILWGVVWFIYAVLNTMAGGSSHEIRFSPSFAIGFPASADRYGKTHYFRYRFIFPAWILLVFFALSNTYSALQAIQGTDQGGINYLAHYAGFVAGITIFFFARKDIVGRYLTGRTI